jgi:hypothetical protein
MSQGRQNSRAGNQHATRFTVHGANTDRLDEAKKETNERRDKREVREPSSKRNPDRTMDSFDFYNGIRTASSCRINSLS